MMNLTRKFYLWSAVLMALVVLIGTLSMLNIYSMVHSARVATTEYDAMDRADAVSAQIAWLRDSLLTANARTYRDVRFFVPIQTEV